ncbi:DUF1120 domain-containing protein [Pseudomonas sp. C1C7]|uniref:DUF1120 domain-containing protein n=1 Tax=Pseudomonas sp. C1C7 TaxID=2735272 RepID=UPI001586150C|nr:DUF1120 domain-containing protein [Pseudomonas sp. C1C7]NUT76537.1 DUF1120 domain-containing protein [Pseudomonas sp. C1C7]
MNKKLNALFAALLLTGGASAFAASSVDLTVTGTITPSACEPTLSQGGLVDYGKISARDLNVDQPTALAQQTVQLTITCDAATLAAVESKDNRAGSAAQTDPANFGLGLINGNEKLGHMNLTLANPVADGASLRNIVSTDNGSTWQPGSSLATDNIISVADSSNVTPIPFQTLTSDLRIDPVIAPANQLTLTNEANMDGSLTLTVRYL